MWLFLYDPYMKTDIYPLSLPAELSKAIRKAAKQTGLSMADTMRQSIRLGLPKLVDKLSLEELKPLTEEECRKCWEMPDPEFDALAAHCAALPKPPPEDS